MVLSSNVNNSTSSIADEDDENSSIANPSNSSFSTSGICCNPELHLKNKANSVNVMRAIEIINKHVPRKSNSVPWGGSGFGKPFPKPMEVEKPPVTVNNVLQKVEPEKPLMTKNNTPEKKEEKTSSVIKSNNTQMMESAQLPTNNDVVKDEHNCLDNLLGKPVVVTNSLKSDETKVSEKPDASTEKVNIAKPPVEDFKEAKNASTNQPEKPPVPIGVHRGGILGFGEKENLEDTLPAASSGCPREGSAEKKRVEPVEQRRTPSTNNRQRTSRDIKKEKRRNQNLAGNNLPLVQFWTGFDDATYTYHGGDKHGFTVVNPTHTYLPKSPNYTANKFPPDSMRPTTDEPQCPEKKNLNHNMSNKTICDDFDNRKDIAVSPLNSMETLHNRDEILPIFIVQLKSGVAKTAVEGRLSEIQAFLHDTKYIKKNWRTVIVPFSPLSEMIVSLCVGCTKINDGADITHELTSVKLNPTDVHLYRPNIDGALSQTLCLDPNSEESTVGSQLWNLPCIEFENIWQNLFYNGRLKNELMSYVYSLIRLSECGVDMNIVTVHRMIMLLGPPGTGKTSLCKGLAQLLSIQLNRTYPRSVMVEINSHSLFSKWFSESGKLVQKMFDHIFDLTEDSKCMVFVLIDEVESLGMSRESSSNRGDPADSIRAVNALITQIDRIRRKKNVLIMCTSNLEKCLDSALMDRIDFVRHVGQPSQLAMYHILYDCIEELQRVGIVDNLVSLNPPGEMSVKYHEPSTFLWTISGEAIGLSARAVRQIPALACAMSYKKMMSLDECLGNIRSAVEERRLRREC